MCHIELSKRLRESQYLDFLPLLSPVTVKLKYVPHRAEISFWNILITMKTRGRQDMTHLVQCIYMYYD